MIKKIINFVLVLALGVALGYVFQPTIDKKIAEKSPVWEARIKARQAHINEKAEALYDEKRAEKEQEDK